MSLLSIFRVISGKMMQACEAPDIWGLHKNKNCMFPLMYVKSNSRESFSSSN